jgi:hypothetical protein
MNLTNVAKELLLLGDLSANIRANYLKQDEGRKTVNLPAGASPRNRGVPVGMSFKTICMRASTNCSATHKDREERSKRSPNVASKEEDHGSANPAHIPLEMQNSQSMRPPTSVLGLGETEAVSSKPKAEEASNTARRTAACMVATRR